MASSFRGIFSVALGVRDVLEGCIYAINIIIRNGKIRNKVFLSFILNGFVLASSVLLFEHAVLPCILLISTWVLGCFGRNLSSDYLASLESILSYTFTGLWMLPMFIICTPINSIWYREIAVEINEHLKISNKKSSKLSLKLLITDILYGIAVEIIYTVQVTAVNLLPIGGQILSVLLMAFLYSLYSFEYKWFYQGFTVQRRLSFIEIKWPYFLGYGLVLSLLTCVPQLLPFNELGGVRHTVGNIVLSTCVFALLFPLMIIASFKTAVPNVNFYQIPIFKFSRFACNKLFNCLLSNNH